MVFSTCIKQDLVLRRYIKMRFKRRRQLSRAKRLSGRLILATKGEVNTALSYSNKRNKMVFELLTK